MPPKKAAKAAKGAPKKEAKADDPERLSRASQIASLREITKRSHEPA